jgi:hypothetical protein
MNDMNDTVSASLWRRRTLLGALGAAPVAVGAVLAGTALAAPAVRTRPDPAGHSARRSWPPRTGSPASCCCRTGVGRCCRAATAQPRAGRRDEFGAAASS